MVRKVDRKKAKMEENEKRSEEDGSFFDIGDTGIDNKVDSKKILEKVDDKERPKGGFVEALAERDKNNKENKEREKKENERKRIKLNDAADVILSCLEPSSSQDIRMAAKDQKIHDIGIYILGLINRLVKTVDYYEPDIEAEWESGKVGYSSSIVCKYCNKEIESPRNIKQLYCSNRCAKRDRDFGETGVLFPNQSGSTLSDMEVDEKKWEQEQKRIGVI